MSLVSPSPRVRPWNLRFLIACHDIGRSRGAGAWSWRGREIPVEVDA